MSCRFGCISDIVSVFFVLCFFWDVVGGLVVLLGRSSSAS